MTLGAVHKNSLETQTKTYHLQCVATHGTLETSRHQSGFSVLPAYWETLLPLSCSFASSSGMVYSLVGYTSDVGTPLW